MKVHIQKLTYRLHGEKGQDMNVSPKRRTETITIRVTPEEKSLIAAMAKRAGMTLTEYIIYSNEITIRASIVLGAMKLAQEGDI